LKETELSGDKKWKVKKVNQKIKKNVVIVIYVDVAVIKEIGD
jgi:hypothetical protein